MKTDVELIDGLTPIITQHSTTRPPRLASDSDPGTNQLDTARQAIRSEAAARERAERSLAEAQVLIRDLRTKLAHERLAKGEALETFQQLETETQAAIQAQETTEAELTVERLARRNAEDALGDALEAESRLRDAMAAQEPRLPSQAPHRLADAIRTRRRAPTAQDADAEQIARAAGSSKTVDDGASTIQARRRGRPAKVGNQDSEVVEWWKPGWREKFR